MAVTVGSVIIHMGVDSTGMTKFTRAADKAVRDSSRIRAAGVQAGNGVAASFTKAGQSAAAFNGHLGGLGARLRSVGQVLGSMDAAAAAAGVSLAGAAIGMSAFVRSADKMRRMENDLRTVTSSYQELRDVQQSLFDVSQRSRAAQDGTVKIYARTARATEHLGLKQKELLRLTETVQKAFAVGGATAQEAMGAAIQLSQGIASDRFSGEEFRSVAENAPVLLSEMARSMGVNIGKMREMAHAGKLTGAVVVNAILDASKTVDEAFAKTMPTVEQQLVRVRNAVDQYVYSVDRSYGITDAFASSLGFLADNFEAVGDVAQYAVAAVAAFMGGRVGGALLKGGLFAGTRQEARKQVKELGDALKAFETERVALEKQIAEVESKSHNRLTDMRLAQTNALASARDKEAKAYERVNALAADRVGITQKLSVAQAAVLNTLKREQQEYRNAVKLQERAYAAASKRFVSSGQSADFERQIREYEKLQQARERYEQSQKTTRTAQLGNFDAVALQRYQEQTKSLYAEMERNNKAQLKAQQDLAKARANYINLQRMGPEIQARARAEIESTNNRLTVLRENHASLVGSIERANEGLVKATRNVSLLGAAGARLKSFGSGVWGLLGGGPGVALTGAIFGFLAIQKSIHESRQETERWKQSLREMGYLADDAADSAESIDKAFEKKNVAALRKTIEEMRAEIEKLKSGGALSGADSIEKIIRRVKSEIADLQLTISSIEQTGMPIPEEFTRQLADSQEFLRIMQAAEEAGSVTESQHKRLQEIAGRWPAVLNDVLIKFLEVREVIKSLEEAVEDTTDKVSKLIDELNSKDIKTPPWVEDAMRQQEAMDEYRKKASDISGFLYDRKQAASLDEETKAIKARTKAIMDAAEEEEKSIDVTRAGIQAREELALERQAKINDGMKDLRLDALAGQMDEWNQKIVKQAQSLGVTRKEIEAYIRAVTSGNMRDVPEVFRQIADAMEDATANSLLKSLQDVSLEQSISGLSEFDQQLVDIARSAGMSYDNLALVIEALRTGNASGLSDVLRKTREELRALAEERAMTDLLFEQQLFGLSDVEKDVAATLHDIYGDEWQSKLHSSIANTIRLNHQFGKTEGELRKIEDASKDTFVGLIDLLDGSGNEMERLIGLFADLGKMFAKIGMEKVYDAMTGKRPMFSALPARESTPTAPSIAYATTVGREIGSKIAPSISGSLDNTLTSYAAAIRKIESGSFEGNYGAIGPVTRSGDRAYGAYQVMGANIESWTKEVLGVAMTQKQFLSDRAAQDKVFYAKFGQSLDKFGSFSDAISVWFSGGPLAQNRHKNDGYNSVPEYLRKVEAAQRSYVENLSGGVSAGVLDANRRLMAANQNDPWAGLRSPTKGGPNLAGMLGVGGAALGAFAGGYQSGSPIMGALNGAMAGLGASSALAGLGLGAAAGPVGIIGGAIIGLLGGIFGKSKQKKEELKKAQEDLKSQLGAIYELMANATGNFIGEFQKQFLSVTDEFQKVISLAKKAKNNALAAKMSDAMETFFTDLSDRWERGFEGMIASLDAGLGFDGAFVKANDAIIKMQESLVGFINDAKFFAQANGDLETALKLRDGELGYKQEALPAVPILGDAPPGYMEAMQKWWTEIQRVGLDVIKKERLTGEGLSGFSPNAWENLPAFESVEEMRNALKALGVEFDEAGQLIKRAAGDAASVAEAVERAQKAAQATALAQLSGAKEFSALETEMQRIQGTAAGLQSTLTKLGMTAEEAAAAIEKGVIDALQELRLTFTEDLARSNASLAEYDYLNEIANALEQFRERMKDAAAIGMSTVPVLLELDLTLRNIAKDAELTDEQLARLAEVFPEIGGNILALQGLMGETGSLALEEAQAAKEQAEEDLRKAYDKEASALEQVISKHEAFIKSLQRFRDDLRLDANLSPLDPYQRFLEAQRQFNETSQLALSGDEDAMDRLEEVSRAYLEEARSYYASSEAYFGIFTQVENILDQALSVADSQLTEAEQQLAALKEQVGALIELNDSVMSVTDAIQKLTEATDAEAAAKEAQGETTNDLLEQILQMFQVSSYDPRITQLYNELVGRNPDPGGAAFWTEHLNNGATIDQIRAAMMASDEYKALHGFSSGGYTGFAPVNQVMGLVHGQEFVAHAEATRRWRPQLEAMNAGSYTEKSNDLVAEVKQLRSDVQRLTSVTASGAQANVQAAGQTTDAVRRQAEVMRRERGRRSA